MVKELDFTKQSVSQFLVGLKEMFAEDVFDESRNMVKEVLEEVLGLEFQGYVQADEYERTEKRTDQRNGYRTRSLMTTWGAIEDIKVPRSRSNGFQPTAFERYKRVHRRVDEGVLKMFLMGVSTRKVGDVLNSLFDYSLSASYVSKVARQLDEEVRKFSDRPLKDEYQYLILDGIVVKVREISESVKRTVLVAYGIRRNGSRELIDFRVAKNEGKGTWASFLKNLQVRGLSGARLDLIVTDGGAGLWAAVEEVYPLVRHSRHRRGEDRHEDLQGVGENLAGQSPPGGQVSRQGHRQAPGVLRVPRRASQDHPHHQRHRKTVPRAEKKAEGHGDLLRHPKLQTHNLLAVCLS